MNNKPLLRPDADITNIDDAIKAMKNVGGMQLNSHDMPDVVAPWQDDVLLTGCNHYMTTKPNQPLVYIRKRNDERDVAAKVEIVTHYVKEHFADVFREGTSLKYAMCKLTSLYNYLMLNGEGEQR